MKRCSMTLINKEMQIKNPITFPLHASQHDLFPSQKTASVREEKGKLEPCILFMEKQNGTDAMAVVQTFVKN
jgi:hypothetical protein